jgi:hypothetical protein
MMAVISSLIFGSSWRLPRSSKAVKVLEHRAQLAGSRRVLDDHGHASPSSSHAFRSSPRRVRASRSRWPSTEPAPIASSRSSRGTVAA